MSSLYVISLVIIILLFIIGYIYYKYVQSNQVKDKFTNQDESHATYSAGIVDTWIVPEGVNEATFTVIGGKGSCPINRTGMVVTCIKNETSDYNVEGGYGANITVILTVIPTTTYTIYVGKNGSSPQQGLCGDGQIGYNGGSGGDGFSTITGGSGGGASVVFINNISTPTATSTNINPIIIAGGGGGGGLGCNGGSAGIDNLGNGETGYDNTRLNGIGGTGGAGGITLTEGNTNGNNSILMLSGGGGGGSNGGGAGSNNTTYPFGGGGGGGGSYINSNYQLTNQNISKDNTGIPSVTITWTPAPTTTVPPTTNNQNSITTNSQNSITTNSQNPTTTNSQNPTTTNSQNPTTTNSSSILSIQSLINDITNKFPNLSQAVITKLISSGVDISTLMNTGSTLNSNDSTRLSSTGINLGSQLKGPSTNIVQVDFKGTSNIYSPYLYYNKGINEKFESIGKRK